MVKFQDFKDILTLLKEKRAEFLVIGGHAVNFYSRMKLTEDLDIWVNPTPENAKIVFDVVNEFGYGSLDLSVEDFIKKDNVVQIGYKPIRIDFMTTIENMNFDDAYKKKRRGYLFGVNYVPYISFDDLVKNKRLAGRPKDKFDIWWLKKYQKPKKIK